jgi:hypothetical protein
MLDIYHRCVECHVKGGAIMWWATWLYSWQGEVLHLQGIMICSKGLWFVQILADTSWPCWTAVVTTIVFFELACFRDHVCSTGWLKDVIHKLDKDEDTWGWMLFQLASHSCHACSQSESSSSGININLSNSWIYMAIYKATTIPGGERIMYIATP